MSGQKNPRNKYFLAVVLPSPVLQEVEEIKNELYLQHSLKGALRSPAHITLHRPFEWPAEKEQKLVELLRDFKQPETFRIGLQNFGFFPPRVIFVAVEPNENLFKLHDELALHAKTTLRLFNETEDMRGFHPHVTIAFRDLKRRHFDILKPLFEKQVFSALFPYTGFSLLKLDKTWKELCFFPLSRNIDGL